MMEYIEKIREVSGNLLKNGEVDVVIGFKKGSLPGINEPYIARKAEDVANLVWDSNCRLNLANYVTNRKDKIGIIAKGCDSRNLVNHIVENRIKREQLVIIGVPCKGMTDRNGTLQNNCALCTHRNPVIHDHLVAEPVEEQSGVDKYADIRDIEAMSADEKWNFFEEAFASCTRCYACKSACPLCYCPTCFVDESTPQWVGKGTDPVDIRTYHLMRAFHCAGRCTDCGACEAACPMEIPVRLFTRKLDKECSEKFGWESGLSTDTRPAMDTFKLDDPEEFIK